tara:strand:- start:1430 stop:2962 length:1533 start_codon:yes stop_codon:yes gene_type:complete
MRAAQASQNKLDDALGVTSELCIFGPNGKRTFDFSGMTHDQKVQAAADAVMSIGTPSDKSSTDADMTINLPDVAVIDAEGLTEMQTMQAISATARQIGQKYAPEGFHVATGHDAVTMEACDDYDDAPNPGRAATPPIDKWNAHPCIRAAVNEFLAFDNDKKREVILRTKQCREQNTCPPDNYGLLLMMQSLSSFKEWNDVAKAYSTLVKMSTIAVTAVTRAFAPSHAYKVFLEAYLNILAFIAGQRICPMVGRAFTMMCQFIGFNTDGRLRVGRDLFVKRDFHAVTTHGSNPNTKVVRMIRLIKNCISDAVPFDDLEHFDANPVWRAIAAKQLCIYERSDEFVCCSPATMKMQADLAAEELLRDEAVEKTATTKQAAAPGKSAKRRARQKLKKTARVEMNTIAEDAELVPDDAEAAAGAVERPPDPESNVFNLSDIGCALVDKQDDAATSVAAELMCIICYAKERSVACVPCGHKCLCEDCGTKDNMSTSKGCHCPMCRKEVIMFMKVFE